MLVGRTAERERIAELLDEARAGRSGALVLTGEPGIGKSALCDWAVAHAGGMTVAAARPVESEVDLPFAGLVELCAPELDDLQRLPEAQRRALEGALTRHGAPTGDRFAVGAALLGLLAAAAEDAPLLVVVDDAQWLDGASADALVFAARRLGNEGVALLIATRPESAFAAGRGGLPRMTVRGLEPAPAHDLLRSAHPAVADEVAEFLIERAQGNPLALVEVPLVLSPAQLAGQEPIDDPLPVGPGLKRTLLHRIAGLPPEARHALLLAAASDAEEIGPVLRAAFAAGLAPDVLVPAEDAGVLTITDRRFAFHHPLLRSAVLQDASGRQRRAAHALLADVTTGEAQVWHRAQATVGEDEHVAADLERVGLDARRRGAPAAATAALERAAALSTTSDARGRRLVEAARDAHVAGRSSRALRLLDDALALTDDGPRRAEIQQVRGRVLVLQGQTEVASRLLVTEAEAIRPTDPVSAAAMLAEACLDLLLGADVRRAEAIARDASSLAAGAGALAVEALAAVMRSAALVLAGRRAEADDLLDRFLPVLRAGDPLAEGGEAGSLAAQLLFWTERQEAAADLLDTIIARARAASAPAALCLPLSCRADLDLRVGRWALAAAHAEEAASLGEEMTRSVFAAYPLESLARLAAAAGDEEGCREYARRATELIEAHDNELGRLYVYSALGLLELGLGRIDAALGHLEPARALAERHGLREPNAVHWHGDLVEAYVRSGETTAAQAALEDLRRQAEGTGGRWALGVALRCEGLLAGEDAFEDRFAAAHEHLEAVSARFEVARTHLCHGERLRRTGRRSDARRALRLAAHEFERLGAAPWSARTRSELAATGATARRGDAASREELTAHELKVAVLVAGGASNREAAGALFLSPKTIEFHLVQIFRKLGIRRRAELAVLAERQGWLETPPA